MQIQILQTTQEIGQAAAAIFCAEVQTNPNAVLGFATGATPIPAYQAMAQACKKGEVSFAGISTFNLDEYCDLPQEHPNSYSSFMWENLFSQIDVQAENVHFLDGNAADIPAQCAQYEERIAALGGIDLQILGIGRNGHIGFNEPGDAFADTTFKIELTQSTIDANKGYFSDREMPKSALTMGIGSIMRAKKIVLIATGSVKAQAVKAMLEGTVTPQCPASILQNHADVTVFLDTEAAALLQK